MAQGRPRKPRNDRGEITRPDGEFARDMLALAAYFEARAAGKGHDRALEAGARRLVKGGAATVAAILTQWKRFGWWPIAVGPQEFAICAGPPPKVPRLPAWGGRDLNFAKK